MAEPRDAQSVTADLVSSGTTPGEPRSVPGGASIASGIAGKATAIGWGGATSPSTSCQKTLRGLHDISDLTTRQPVSGNGADVAPHCPNHDRPRDCGSAQGPGRGLRAACGEGFAL